MPRPSRLPPLRTKTEVANHHFPNHAPRRLSFLTSSDARTDASPIDFILVYHKNDHDQNNGTANTPKLIMSRRERREQFEHYLAEKQCVVLVPVIAKRDVYVKVHTPFKVLLSTAENMRMRLPIEKIDENENEPATQDQTCWYRFQKWCQKPFRLDPSLTKDDPDYYTAIYSSKITKFQNLFDTLRRNKEAYFTAGERSLLTYQLLARGHSGSNIEDEEDRKPVEKKPAVSSMIGLHHHSSRPGIHGLISAKIYTHCYPLHESLRNDLTDIEDDELNDREKLQKHWATMKQCFKFQPLWLIRSYMGEKVAFYFALCGFYNQMLIPAALVGLIIFIYGAASVASDQPTSDICGDFGQNTCMCPRCDKTCPFWKLSDSCVYSKMSFVFDNIGTVIFAILMSIWTRWFVELWKRREAVLRYEWDSMDFEEQLEPIRQQFEEVARTKGVHRKNPVTGKEEPYISSVTRIPFFLIAFSVVLFAMCIVCATVFGTVVYRVQMDFILKNTSAKNYSSIIITVTSAVMNLICSLILTTFYYRIARKLTDLEYYKFQSNYDDALTVKIYSFQFVSFYSSLFYIAFFKGRFVGYPSKNGQTGAGDFTEQCDPAGCLVELSIQLIIIMIGRQLINLLVQFITAVSRSCTRVCCRRHKSHKLEQWEIDKDLFDFNANTLSDEYLEIVTQFGFVTLFVVAFPLAPLFALINNLIEIRLDAWKLLSKYKRPIPYKASDIGIWSDIISTVSYIAILTNAIVIAWTSEFIPKMVYRTVNATGTNLNGYVNWTLSSFPIQDYNLTGTLTPCVPSGLTYCRYRDFRESVDPYDYTIIYWNVLAGRLAFIIVFEHLVFFILYIMQRSVADVPKKTRDKINHERYIDQQERWADRTPEQQLRDVITASTVVTKLSRGRSESARLSTIADGISSSNEQRRRPRSVRLEIPSAEEY